MIRSKIVKFIFWATAGVALLYSSYRYPLQINSADTSPTYSDTPPLLQAGKYLILAMACVVMSFAAGGFYLSRRRLGFVALYVLLCAYPIIRFIFDRDARYLTFPFVAIVVLFLSVSVRGVNAKSIDAFIKFTIFFSLIVNLAEVILFFTVGRLPALAYEDTIAVRFGSFLDDPNGFGALLFLLLGHAWCSPRTLTNRVCLCGIFLSVVLTQSLTALGFLALLIVAWGFTNHFKTTLAVSMLGFVVALLPSLFEGRVSDDNGLLQSVFSAKQASSDEHFSAFKVNNPGDLTMWILGGADRSITESWWIDSLNNYGLIWTALLFCMFSAFLWRLYIVCRTASCATLRRVAWGALLFSIYVVIASVNLPFVTVFPINFIFMMFLCLFMLEKLRDHEVS